MGSEWKNKKKKKKKKRKGPSVTASRIEQDSLMVLDSKDKLEEDHESLHPIEEEDDNEQAQVTNSSKIEIDPDEIRRSKSEEQLELLESPSNKFKYLRKNSSNVQSANSESVLLQTIMEDSKENSTIIYDRQGTGNLNPKYLSNFKRKESISMTDNSFMTIIRDDSQPFKQVLLPLKDNSLDSIQSKEDIVSESKEEIKKPFKRDELTIKIESKLRVIINNTFSKPIKWSSYSWVE